MESLQLKVSLNFQQLLEVVKQLSPAEKIKLNDFIWNDNIDIPLEHQELVLDRVKKSQKNPARMLDWDEACNALNINTATDSNLMVNYLEKYNSLIATNYELSSRLNESRLDSAIEKINKS